METSQALRHEYRELVVGVLAEGTATGEFRPGDDRLRTLQIFGSVHWMWTWFDPAGPRARRRGGRLVRGYLPRRVS